VTKTAQCHNKAAHSTYRRCRWRRYYNYKLAYKFKELATWAKWAKIKMHNEAEHGLAVGL
jgi:hypothetical protein